MTTQVIYQRWRPRRFADLVGQQPIVQTLRQAVTQERVAHAYLFCGPRGTGKTSTARILAKALNCQSLAPGAAPSGEVLLGEPDNSCPFCLAVNEGRAMDLIEMDAASHRGIDDIRSMRERVFGGGPAGGRCKVYIIDEAHMLTEPAFNALLKTLEEPAPWAYFILCTTEPHKIPATIISRCQRFDFRRITPSDVVGRLETICQEEGIQGEPEALRAIARATEGSLRDAENVLEQLAISSISQVTLAGVEELLGLVRDTAALELVRHVLAADLPGGLAVIHGASASGADLRAFHRDLVEFLRAVLLLKTGVAEALDYPAPTLEEIRAVAENSSWERLFQAVKLFGGATPRPGEFSATLPLELALVECTATPPERPGATPEHEATLIAPPPAPKAAPASNSAPPPLPAPEPKVVSPKTSTPMPGVPPAAEPPLEVRQPVAPSTPATVSTSVDPNEPPNAAGQTPQITEQQWGAICGALKRVRGSKYVLGSLLLDCRERHLEDDSLVLLFRNRANLDRLQEELQHLPSQQAIQEAIRATLGRNYTLNLDVAENQSTGPRRQGYLVRTAMAMGATIIEETEEES